MIVKDCDVGFDILECHHTLEKRDAKKEIMSQNGAMSTIQGKRALVTGGGSGEPRTALCSFSLSPKCANIASGINLALVRALHGLGCSVLIADRSLHQDASQWRDSLEGESAQRAGFYKIDVTHCEEFEKLFDAFASQFGGPPDIVVAGAGIYEASSAGFWNEEDSPSSYKVLDVNLVHPIKLTRLAIRRLQQAKIPGVVVHLSSITAQKPSVVLPLYSVSKAAISQFVRCMGPLDAMAPIRIVAVAPG